MSRSAADRRRRGSLVSSRRGRAVAAVAACLLAGACTTSAGSSTGDKGYVAGDGAITVFDKAHRDPAPEVAGDAVGAGTVSLAGFAGKVVVINVWGSWCGPCRSEADDLVEAAKEMPDTAFLGINTRDTESAAEAFVRAQKIPYDSLFDPSGKTLLGFYGRVNPATLPTTLVIDRTGDIAAMVSGETTASTLEGLVEDVRSGS